MARTDILIQLTTATVPSTATLQHLAASGEAIFHVRRADASLRRIQYLAPGTAERATAEQIEAMKVLGQEMKAIARKLHVSVPTVRRIINSLEMTLAVEAGEMEHALELADKED